jgi:hypothetical protein
MIRRSYLLAVVPVLLWVGSAGAQQSHPMVEAVAKHVVQKYQMASCQDIAKERSRPPQQHTELEQRAVQILRTNPDIRVEFINRVAAPIANKLFDCGMLP